MPSRQPLPEIPDYLQAYAAEISALHRQNADVRRGSGYDIFGGTNAVLFSRQAIRDRDVFRAIYFDACYGDDVDTLIQARFGEMRIPAAPGTGTAVFQRPTSGAGSDTILAGTRVAIIVTGAEPRYVEVSTDTSVSSTQTSVIVPVETITAGASLPISATFNTAFIRLEDPLKDPSWAVVSVTVGAGTDREKDADYKARTRTDRLSKRVGYAKSITDACIAQGAGQVALFASNFLGDDLDHGINRCFVGSASYQSTPDLVTACRIAVDSVRVLGADLLVYGMTQQALSLLVTVNLWLPPAQRNQAALQGAAAAAVVEYLNTLQNAFHFRVSAMRGAVLRALRTDVQSVDFFDNSDPQNPVAMTELNLLDVVTTAQITRYYTTPANVVVSIQGPS